MLSWIKIVLGFSDKYMNSLVLKDKEFYFIYKHDTSMLKGFYLIFISKPHDEQSMLLGNHWRYSYDLI